MYPSDSTNFCKLAAPTESWMGGCGHTDARDHHPNPKPASVVKVLCDCDDAGGSIEDCKGDCGTKRRLIAPVTERYRTVAHFTGQAPRYDKVTSFRPRSLVEGGQNEAEEGREKH